VILKRFYNEKLAQATYLLGSATAREALVVDPNRDLDPIIRAASAEGLRIVGIAETHIHADFVSGARELAILTGAEVYLSGHGDEDWGYRFPTSAVAKLVHDGDEIEIGEVRVSIMHTPGHTPEHISLIVTDRDTADEPMGAFTGDFLFVGDVGRPDLLERAANMKGTMEASARDLHRSIEAFRTKFPDYLQVWPGHGAGSACGKSLGAVPQTTLGYEKLFNPALQHRDESAFVSFVLEGQPDPPLYFARMKQINRDGPPAVAGGAGAPHLEDHRLAEVINSGAAVLDTRTRAEYSANHAPGTYHAPDSSKAFLTWAGSVLPYDSDIYIIADRPRDVARDLALIGLDRIAGSFNTSAPRRWLDQHPDADGEQSSVDADTLAPSGEVKSDAFVLDVRNSSEWNAGHIPGSTNVPLGRLLERLPELPTDRPITVHCQSGARATVAIAALQAHGFDDVHHLKGDFAGWEAAGKVTWRESPGG
jgi:hydroxyacylglutathione hydrolase